MHFFPQAFNFLLPFSAYIFCQKRMTGQDLNFKRFFSSGMEEKAQRECLPWWIEDIQVKGHVGVEIPVAVPCQDRIIASIRFLGVRDCQD